MSLPTAEELRAAIAAHLADPTQQASATSIAGVVRDLLEETALDEPELCSENGCPYPRVEGLESCVEHTVQDLVTLRRQVREATDA